MTGYDIAGLVFTFLPGDERVDDNIMVKLINLARKQLETSILILKPVLLLEEKAIAVTSGTNTIDLASEGVTINIQAVYWGDKRLSYEPSLMKLPDTRGTPEIYNIRGTTLFLYPIPSESGTLTIYHLKNLMQISSLDDSITGDPIDLSHATALYVAMMLARDNDTMSRLTALYNTAIKSVEERLKGREVVTGKSRVKPAVRTVIK